LASQEFAEAVVKNCTDYWSQIGKAYLLSQLGLDLRRAGFVLALELNGRKLLPYVQSELATSIRTERNPDNPIIWGAFPRSAALTQELRFYFRRSDQHDLGHKAPIPRIDSRLWAAFSIPLSEEKVRRIAIEPEIMFWDAPDDSEDVEGTFLIERERIIPAGTKPPAERAAELYSQISAWTQKNGFQIDRFLARTRDRPGESSQTAARGNTALHRIIDLVDPKDRPRIAIPLDVAQRLLAKEN
jgi:hypothetical protein